MKISDLKCEYTTNPIGLDIATPQFSWQSNSEKRGFIQNAYQVIVTISDDDLNRSKSVWDSGKMLSAKSAGILYSGPELESRRRYFWLVRTWDANGNKAESSEPAYFEMGLLKASDWQSNWIGCPAKWTGRVLYFRRSFAIQKTVVKARIYISGLGYYELFFNGCKVGDHVLDPGTCDYSKRVLYSTYDISNLFKAENVLDIKVGPGWYGIPKLRLQAEITYHDDSFEVLSTCWDPYQNWWVTTGPTIHSSIFDGEMYDARDEFPGWNMPNGTLDSKCRTSQWINAVVTDAPGGQMVSQIQEPIKAVETLCPTVIGQPSHGIYVLDAGRNLAGWAAIKVHGERGRKITLLFAETLNSDGTVNQENLRSAIGADTYILKGEGEEEWEPSFTYHGFRYIQVEGFPHKPEGDDIEIRVVRSAVGQTGWFKCSNQLLNRIHSMVFCTEANNLHSIPTDCPQRDERMGWLNDMTVRIEQAIYNFDMARFYLKWIDDISDTQEADGSITDTAPFRWGFRPADPVSASYLLTALKSYEFYGNLRIITQHYEGLKSWVDYLNSVTEDGILNYSYWGDWSPPVAFGTPGSIGSGAVSAFTPGNLISTGYLFYCAKIISQIAAIIGNKNDEYFYQNLAGKTAISFNKTWWNDNNGGYGTNNQACNSFALFLGLVEKEHIGRVVANLVKNVEENDFHLTTGNLCTKYLLEMLTENGHAEIAYKIATKETYPGWGFMLANGATTLWERWENKTGGEMNSHNHPMLGSIGSWFFKYLAGIQPDVAEPGFGKFTIKPYIIDDISFVEGEYLSVKGMVKSAWRKDSASIFLNVTIPGNSSATVFIPVKAKHSITEGNQAIEMSNGIIFLRMEGDYAVYEVGSGVYQFKSTW